MIKLNRFAKNDTVFLLFCIAIGVAVYSITLVRAATTGITYDEAYTYIFYVKQFSIDQILNPVENLANNQLLNTFAIFSTERFFDSQYNELVIRAPAILSFMIFLVGSAILSKTSRWRYVLFVLLSMNYYVDEFFGLARGYSLATAFVLLSLVFLQRCTSTKDTPMRKDVVGGIVLAIIASFANTISLIWLFCYVVLLIIHFRINKNSILLFLKKNIVPLILMSLPVAYLLFYHLAVTGTGKPVFGSPEFSQVFKRGFSWMLFGGNGFALLIQWVFFALLVLSVVLSKGKIFRDYRFLLMLIMLIMLMAPSLIMQKPFPVARALIPFWPVMAVGFVAILNGILPHGRMSTRVHMPVTAAFLVIIALSFCLRIDLHKTTNWGGNYIIKDLAYSSLYRGIPVADDVYEEHKAAWPVWEFYKQQIDHSTGFDIFRGW